ncbi:alpha/beta hydrolase [Rhodoligotrophos defluvii]|uniref:alpha/beta hydrolase n=1 Tax=Rhodoligotrophos defluvii TaxID=2561934 RepID=UPI0010C9EBE5|nr:alpha/beta hydrolase [Rhodoligotrophos defluvii]
MASEQSQHLRMMYRSLADRCAAHPDMDLETMRDVFERLHQVTPEPEAVTYKEDNASGVPVLWCIPDDGASDRVLMHSHGGGFMVLSMHTDRKLAGHIAKAVGIRALVLDFRLAPKHPFPAQIEDAVTAYRWLLDQGIRPEHIVSEGHSAGGNLCTSMVLKLRREGLPLPAAIMPTSPWYDMELKGATLDSLADKDAIVQRPILDGMVGAFLGDTPPNDPLANPLHADLTGLPPILIHTGEHETLLDDTHRFAARAQQAGVDVTVRIGPEMQHSYIYLAGRAPEADDALAHMRHWVRPKLGLS